MVKEVLSLNVEKTQLFSGLNEDASKQLMNAHNFATQSIYLRGPMRIVYWDLMVKKEIQSACACAR